MRSIGLKTVNYFRQMRSILDMLQGFVYTSGKKIRKKAKVHTLFLFPKSLQRMWKLDLNKYYILNAFLCNVPFQFPVKHQKTRGFFKRFLLEKFLKTTV